MRFLPYLVLLIPVTPPVWAQLSDLSLGLGGSLETSAYKMRYRDYSVLPVLNYDDDTWYLDGAEAGYYLINDDVNELKIKAYYDFTSYNSNLGHGDAMRSLKDRHGSLMAGFSYQYTTDYGAVHTQEPDRLWFGLGAHYGAGYPLAENSRRYRLRGPSENAND